MCGITGIYSFSTKFDNHTTEIKKSINVLKNRGPNAEGVFEYKNIGIGHTRLSVIDTSSSANQPFFSADNNYAIVFNGEFYNFKEHRIILKTKSYKFNTESDTEVLLNMYIEYGEKFLEKVNGCFSLAIIDKKNESLFIARDRYGIKPLYVYSDDEKIIFSSEMKGIMAYDIERNINFQSLFLYFQFNYIPGVNSILNNVFRLTPGTYLKINKNGVTKTPYYKIPYTREYSNISYQEAQNKLKNLLNESVEKRMISDVPLGAFLSGGIDSSVITAIASKLNPNLNTFSIGYKDEPFFDETDYALEVAKKFNTNHHTFKLTNNDLFEHLFEILDYIDEPFADSSAIPVYILSKNTKKSVTVALSGDGADEIFSGYNKHKAHFNVLNNNLLNPFIKSISPIIKSFPQSRNSLLLDKFRKINKYSKGLSLSHKERYWLWASLNTEENITRLFNNNINKEKHNRYKNELLEEINSADFNDILYTDVNMVLQYDMLTKVDSMSMANSLEVRTPFLDNNIVDFAFSLPVEYKINNKMAKRILQDSYKDILPYKIYNRPKHGFEVPLLKWFKTDLHSLINNELLEKDFIINQNIFDYNEIEKLKSRLFSKTPQDIQSQIWALIVFQHWWKKYF
jgi:asparagine synthase (glutamine-hydrolysing)